jgi:predicted membrane chloride channel (bestrophin family)
MSQFFSIGSYRSSAISLWSVLFRLEGNVLFAVLPFCIANCLLLWLVSYYRETYNFGFSPTGHGLLTLLVSFLVISKVNLAYDRYRAVRYHAGQGAMVLRELIQIVITVSSASLSNNNNLNNDPKNDQGKELRCWRSECVAKVTNIMDTTVRVLQDYSLAKHFAHNKPLKKSSVEEVIELDPLVHVQSLRLHLYCTSDLLGLDLLERINLVNKLQEYTREYTNLLILSSTPIPFPLTQMGRAFLFIWVFSMPLVLLEGPFSDFWSALAFLFFLTYGFIGLELVSIKLSDPFGHSQDDVQLSSIRDATIDGIENDLKHIPNQTTISERRLRFSMQKRQTKSQDHHDQGYGYHAMAGTTADLA